MPATKDLFDDMRKRQAELEAKAMTLLETDGKEI
jgi:hypothetical protein